jgi:3D-(3,5/4)-trihydroxycyclohexane-1,2-dione acylhydrolase (decyclizing)
MLNAMRVLTHPADSGAVTIALPQDVQGEAWDYPVSFFTKRVHRIERRQPSVDSVKDAVNLIRSNKKPLLILGGGVRYSEATDAFVQFAEKFLIPFGETQAGKSAIESNHPLNLGGLGVTGNLAANSIAKDADLIIAVGTRFTDFTTASKQLFGQADILNINISEFHASKLDAVKVVADAKAGLEAISAALGDYISGYQYEIVEVKQHWEDELHRLYGVAYGENFTPEIAGHLDSELSEYKEVFQSELTQTSVIGKVNQLLDDNAVIVGAAGSLPGDLQRMWVSKTRNTYHMEYGYSCMGYEIAGALGAKLADPNKEVYAMTGDGSFLMLHSELVTSLQEGKKINVLLFDNSGFGCINNLQMENGMGSYATEFRKRTLETGKMDGPIMEINYAKVAEGYGVKTYSVRTLKELEEAVMDSKKQKVSTLIDIKVLPKTMTHGYDSWWNVGVAEVSNKESIKAAYERKQTNLEKARAY